MADKHPITPPSELVQQWQQEADSWNRSPKDIDHHIATRAAQWGADKELEACCEFVLVDLCCGTKFQRRILVKKLRERRRPIETEPTDLELCKCYTEAYYANEDRQGPAAQAAGLRAVLNKWGKKSTGN